jgi:hypothetical protein
VADILGTFEQAVLLAVVRLGEDAYGRAILKATQVRLERDVAAGAVHATLERLERKGLLSSRLGPGRPYVLGVQDGITVSSRPVSAPSMMRAGPSTTSGAVCDGQ